MCVGLCIAVTTGINQTKEGSISSELGESTHPPLPTLDVVNTEHSQHNVDYKLSVFGTGQVS